MILVEIVYGVARLIFAPMEWIARNWSISDWIRVFEVAAVAIAIVVFVVEFRIDRPRDRAVRIATLFAQIAQVHALENGEGLRALKPTVEALASERVPLLGLDLRHAKLEFAELNGGDFRNVYFGGAVLKYAKLRGANLRLAKLNGVNLGGAKLNGAVLASAYLESANLYKATLLNADLSGADLKAVTGLSQPQLDEACAKLEDPPQNLPKGMNGTQLVWRGKSCVD